MTCWRMCPGGTGTGTWPRAAEMHQTGLKSKPLGVLVCCGAGGDSLKEKWDTALQVEQQMLTARHAAGVGLVMVKEKGWQKTKLEMF